MIFEQIANNAAGQGSLYLILVEMNNSDYVSRDNKKTKLKKSAWR